MQKLADISLRRPIFGSMIVIALVVVGVASYFRLGVDRYPTIDLPQVSIRTELTGASPEETETTITQPIEEVVNTIEGITELRSISTAGRSTVNVFFQLERDIDTAAQDVRDRVATVIRRLPRDATPPVITKTNDDLSPVLTLGLFGDLSIRELTELADKVVKPILERSSGVGNVSLQGELERAINIWVDADRLAAYQMPINVVRDALVRQNTDTPGGNVTDATSEQTLRTMGKVLSPVDFNDLVISTIDGSPIRIRDIGYAEDGTKEQRSISRLNGVPNVTLDVRRQTGANTVEVIEGVKGQLARVQTLLPPGVEIQTLRDQSEYIYAALHEINVHLIAGSILACLVVFLFMRSWRAMVIAGVAIPCSLISSFGLMQALDFTLNSVTMLALVLMVGIVIDDAIVVLENIYRFVEEKKLAATDAAREATKEIGLAVMATTFSLAVIFIPVSFMSSVSGRFLYQFGITAAVAVLVSLLVSFTLTPLMSSRLLQREADKHKTKDHAASRRGFYRHIDRIYAGSLAFSMRHRPLVVVVALLVMLSSIPLYRMVRQEFIPGGADEGEFEVSVNAPEGMSVASMDQAMIAVQNEIIGSPGVQSVLVSVGGQQGLGQINQGNIYVKLLPHEQRVPSVTRFIKSLVQLDPGAAFRGNISQQQIMQGVRARVRQFRDLRVSVRNPQTVNIGNQGRGDLNLVFRGPDVAQMVAYAERLRTMAPNLGVLDATVSLNLDKPELRVQVDRERAADMGVDIDRVASTLRLMVGGDQQVSRYHDNGINYDYDVQLRLSQEQRHNPDTISRLYILSQRGELVRLDNLVKMETVRSANQIGRVDRQRGLLFSANLAPGSGLTDRIQVLRQAVDTFNMPPEYSVTITGQARELENTFFEFIFAFILSLAFMYMILASQYESLIHPLTILLSIPLAVPFALFSMWVMGGSLNLYSALGILVLFGVVKKNSILQVDHMNGLRAKGMERGQAIMQANRDRLRPILMTTLALVAGMLPMLLGSGPGAEEKRTIAVVVVGGQSLALFLTLVVTPVVYSLFDDALRLVRRQPTPIPAYRSAVAGSSRTHNSGD